MQNAYKVSVYTADINTLAGLRQKSRIVMIEKLWLLVTNKVSKYRATAARGNTHRFNKLPEIRKRLRLASRKPSGNKATLPISHINIGYRGKKAIDRRKG